MAVRVRSDILPIQGRHASDEPQAKDNFNDKLSGRAAPVGNSPDLLAAERDPSCHRRNNEGKDYQIIVGTGVEVA